MFTEEIPDNVKTTTHVVIRYDCNGGFERCSKLWTLKFKDADKNFKKNKGKHICKKCSMSADNPASKPEVRAKMEKTCIERYGTSCVLNTEENTAARVEKMFGTESATQKIVDKRKKTSQEKYGTDHPMQNEEIKAKQQAVLTERYGTHVPLQNEEIKAKMQKTVQERYGVANVAMLPEVRAKMARTMYENYGVEHYNQLPEMKDYLRENCREWLKESWESGGPNKGVPRPEAWNQKQREAVMQLIDEGKWNSGPKHCVKGHYRSKKCKRTNPMFRSSYELKTHWHLDNDPDVEWYDYEPFRVAYYDVTGHKRHYVIDFVVKYHNNDRPLAIEVKNDYSNKLELTLLKKKSFQEECEKILDYEIWANDKVKSLNLDLETLLESSLVKSL